MYGLSADTHIQVEIHYNAESISAHVPKISVSDGVKDTFSFPKN
jgi:hypothetical protein